MRKASNASAAFGADDQLQHTNNMGRSKPTLNFTNKCDRLFENVQKIVAHPHTTLTAHDRCRAAVLMRYIYDDDDTVEYIYSTLTQEEFKLIQQIQKDVGLRK